MSIIKIYFPEGFLAFSAIALLIFNTLLIHFLKFKMPILNVEILHQIFTILVLLLFLLSNIHYFNIGFDFFFFSSFFSQNLKFFLIISSIFFLILIWRSFILQKLNFFEYFIILLLVLVGLLLLLNAYNFISIYLCLEIQALGFYILASFDRTSIFSSVAGLKYFISSSLISGIFLFGAVCIYGSFGTLNIYHIKFLFLSFFEYSNHVSFLFLIIGFFLILNTLLFKLVIAPFHFWFPQIYVGSPLSSTILFSTLPKIVLFHLFLQIWTIIPQDINFFNTIYLLIGFYSIFWGIFKMLKQKTLKNIYIFSSISNMGLLLCLSINSSLESISVIYFYLFIYLFTAFLLWFSLILSVLNNKSIVFLNYPLFITKFSNILKEHYLFALATCFIFFSLAAIPPFCGFFSKTYLYLILLNSYQYEVSIFLIYLGVFGVYYYIKFLKILFSEPFHNYNTFSFYSFIYLNLDVTAYSYLLGSLIFLGFNPNIFLLFFC